MIQHRDESPQDSSWSGDSSLVVKYGEHKSQVMIRHRTINQKVKQNFIYFSGKKT